MDKQTEARQLKANQLLQRTLSEFRAGLVDRMIDSPAESLVAAQAGIRVVDEFTEMLNERIERTIAGDGDADNRGR